MYIVTIAWLYVVLLMSLTETSFGAALATLVFYGLLPLGLLGYLLGAPGRRRRRQQARTAAAAQTDPAQSSSQISDAIRPLPPSRRKE